MGSGSSGGEIEGYLILIYLASKVTRGGDGVKDSCNFNFVLFFSEKTDFCIRSYMIIASTSYLALFLPSYNDPLFLFLSIITIYFLFIGL